MYGLTNFLAVLWHTVAGWFGVGRGEVHAVTLFNGDDETPKTDRVRRQEGLVFTSRGDAIANGGFGVRVGGDEDGPGLYH